MESGKFALWTIRISDGHCEWEYSLNGGGEYSIDDLIQIIRVHTHMQVLDERLIEPNEYSDKK